MSKKTKGKVRIVLPGYANGYAIYLTPYQFKVCNLLLRRIGVLPTTFGYKHIREDIDNYQSQVIQRLRRFVYRVQVLDGPGEACAKKAKKEIFALWAAIKDSVEELEIKIDGEVTKKGHKIPTEVMQYVYEDEAVPPNVFPTVQRIIRGYQGWVMFLISDDIVEDKS